MHTKERFINALRRRPVDRPPVAAVTTGPDLCPKTKVRIGKVYMGHTNPGWPSSKVNLPAEVADFDQHLDELAHQRGCGFVAIGSWLCFGGF